MLEKQFEGNVDQVDEVETHDAVEPEPIYYRAIRFKTGEEIVCGVTATDIDHTIKKFITVHNPMIVNENGELRDWSGVSDEDFFEISTDMIRYMVRIKVKIEDKYLALLDEQYYTHLKELLKDETLTTEEREEIEVELADLYDGSEPPTPEKEPTLEDRLRDAIVTSKYIH